MGVPVVVPGPVAGRSRKFAPGGRGRPVALPSGSPGWSRVGRRRRVVGVDPASSQVCVPLRPPRPAVALDLGGLASPVVSPPCSPAPRPGPAATAAGSPVRLVAVGGLTLDPGGSEGSGGLAGPVGLVASTVVRPGPPAPPALSSVISFPPLLSVGPGQVVVATAPRPPPLWPGLRLQPVRPNLARPAAAIYGCAAVPFPPS